MSSHLSQLDDAAAMVPKTADVSVVIPAYNSAHLLKRCVDSILAQTRPVQEILIVDDGSTDNTHNAVKALAGPIRYVRQQNRGPAAARNAGIREARCAWIAFLDADDRWLPEKIAMQMRFAAENPNVDLIYADLQVIQADGTSEGNFLADKGPASGWIFDRLLESSFILPSTVLARKEALVSAGMFNEKLRGPEDYDLWLRLSQRHQIGLIPFCLAIYERQPQSLTRNEVGMAENLIDVFDRIGTTDLTRSQKRTLRRRYAQTLFDLSYMVRGTNPRRALSCAWRSLCMRPSAIATWRLLPASLWFVIRQGL